MFFTFFKLCKVTKSCKGSYIYLWFTRVLVFFMIICAEKIRFGTTGTHQRNLQLLQSIETKIDTLYHENSSAILLPSACNGFVAELFPNKCSFVTFITALWWGHIKAALIHPVDNCWGSVPWIIWSEWSAGCQEVPCWQPRLILSDSVPR